MDNVDGGGDQQKKTRIVVGADMKADANRNYSVESQFGC